MSIIYVLSLEENKFYIGRTNDLQYRYDQHVAGEGSAWTRKYRVINIIDTVTNKDFEELAITLSYMKRYGIENVRGADYVQFILPEEQLKEIKRHLAHDNGECLFCGLVGHYITDCPKRKKETLYEKFIKLFSKCFDREHKDNYYRINEGVITFGKHKDKYYEDVWKNDRNYCYWVIQQKSVNRNFLDFQNWCKEKIEQT
jgi:predicted GIY-YIG superfamily endonuclease